MCDGIVAAIQIPLARLGFDSNRSGIGIRCIEGQVLQENTTMLDMCRQLGFQIVDDPNDPMINLVRLELR